MNIVIIGGTGLIGSKLIQKLREHGHRAVPASPDTGVDTLTGGGLDEALGDMRAKAAQENLIRSSPIPYSIVHATQFFEFVRRIADEATDGERVRVPHALIQPIAADDVAKAVCRVAVGSPVNGIVEVAGPEIFHFDELIRQGLAASNDRRRVIADPSARYFGALLGERTLLPGADASIGETHFQDWLSKQKQVAGAH